MLWLKTVFDFLGTGSSWTVVGLPLLLLLVVFAAERLPAPWRDSWTPLLPIGLLLLHLMCVLERYLFCAQNGLLLAQSQVVVRDGRFAVTSSSSIGESQAVLAWLTRLTGGEVEVGFPFLLSFPGWLMALHATLFLAVSVVGLLAILEFQRSKPLEWTICLTMAVYALLRAGVEEGPLTAPALISIPFVLGLLYGDRAANAGLIFSLLGFPLSLWLAQGWGPWGVALRALGCFLIFLVPLFWERGRQTGETVWKVLALGCVPLLFALPWLQVKVVPRLGETPFTQGTIIYLGRTLLPGGEFVIAGPPGLKDPGNSVMSFVDQLHGQHLTVYRVKLHQKIGIRELCEMFDLDPTTHPIIWDRAPAYVKLTGIFPKPFPRPASEMLLGYRLSENEGVSTLEMTLQGSAGWYAAFDALPGLCIITDFRTSRKLPTEFQGWLPGAGFGKWEPLNRQGKPVGGKPAGGKRAKKQPGKAGKPPVPGKAGKPASSP